MANPSPQPHTESTPLWRDTMHPLRFLGVHWGGAVGWLIFLLHMRPNTLYFALGTTVFFGALEQRGLTPDVALRMLRCRLAGSWRPPVDPLGRVRAIDTGSR